jgi:hypothetical protein
MLNHLLKNVILVINIKEDFSYILFRIYFSIDIGRATYAEMLYRTNLVAYVPADHSSGLSSNAGKSSKKY